jgi:hypothetical protein
MTLRRTLIELTQENFILFQVVENGVFVKHCKVEVYLLELRLCKDFNLENEIRHKFSKSDTIGKHKWN